MPKKIGSGKGLSFIEALFSLPPTNECIVWPFYIMPNGYPQVATHEGMELAHRHVCKRKHGPPPPDKPQTRHLCGKNACVNPQHVFWGTQTDNETDKYLHGTWHDRISNSKITPEIVRSIRKDAVNMSHQELSEKYQTPKSTIKKVVNRHTWKHVT